MSLTRQYAYQGASLSLAPGDAVVLYTDGVVEAKTTRGDDYGEAPLETTLEAAAANTSSAALNQAIVESVQAFTAGAPQSDDLTLLTVRYQQPA